MKIISHRGNLEGKNPLLENRESFVVNAILAGYYVEVDVWNISGEWFLGHDEPQYRTKEFFLRKPELWCHAKNVDALHIMLKVGIHCFWHQKDNYTITSEGYIWAYPGMILTKNSICVMPERVAWENFNNCAGICTDYPNKYKRLINEL